MSLRRFLVASSLILSPVAVIGVQSAAFAQSTGNVILSGSVPSILQIQTTATPEASSLPLSTPGTQTVKIADIVVTQNNSKGVTMTATSTNSSSLVNSNNASDLVFYGIDIVADGGTPAAFSSLSTFSRGVNGNLDLYIQFTNPSVPKQGSYSDTITLTVADN